MFQRLFLTSVINRNKQIPAMEEITDWFLKSVICEIQLLFFLDSDPVPDLGSLKLRGPGKTLNLLH